LKKGTGIFIIIALVLVVLGLSIQTTVHPSDTRVIVDHTKKVYSAPECFDQAELSNHLEEVTYGYAIDLGYEAESSCTTEATKGERKSLLVSWFQ
jgi:hypothetical protein